MSGPETLQPMIEKAAKDEMIERGQKEAGVRVIQLICGDSLKIMPRMAGLGMKFDMIFIDPPYHERGTGKIGDHKPSHRTLSALCYKLLKPNGVIWLCGTQPQLLNDWDAWGRFFKLQAEIIWSKSIGTMAINKYNPLRTHENIWLLIRKDAKVSDTKLNFRTKKGKKYIRKQFRDKTTAMRTRTGEYREWLIDAGYIRSVYNHPPIKPTSKEYYGHPTQKPLGLMRRLIKASTEEGDWILDPFAGSGTTLIAAKELNRNAIGIEINPEYCKMIRKRIDVMIGLKGLERWAK